jgi:hypothetical protein
LKIGRHGTIGMSECNGCAFAYATNATSYDTASSQIFAVYDPTSGGWLGGDGIERAVG